MTTVPLFPAWTAIAFHNELLYWYITAQNAPATDSDNSEMLLKCTAPNAVEVTMSANIVHEVRRKPHAGHFSGCLRTPSAHALPPNASRDNRLLIKMPTPALTSMSLAEL